MTGHNLAHGFQTFPRCRGLSAIESRRTRSGRCAIAKGQCMAISHLPQVAAKAAHHWMVQKTVVGERMQTSVMHLDPEARIHEIARLLSGEVICPHEPNLAASPATVNLS